MSLISHLIRHDNVYHHLMELLTPQAGVNRLESYRALPQDFRERMSAYYVEMTQTPLSDRVVDFLGSEDLKEIVQKLAWEIFRILPRKEKNQVFSEGRCDQNDSVRLLENMSKCLGDWTPDMQTRIDLWAQNRSDLVQLLIDFLKKENLTTISLQEFNLNRLSYLFSQVPFSRRLKVFDLADNEFTEIPEEIFSLSSLQELNLRCNKLESVPEEIGLLSNLTILVLSYNQISSLPNAIGRLPHLSLLYVSDNKLSMLPLSIGELQNLKELWLNGNRLSRLPHEIGLLSQLKRLELSYNSDLSEVPNSILIRELDHLGLIGTAFADEQRPLLEALQASSFCRAGIVFLSPDDDEEEERGAQMDIDDPELDVALSSGA